MYMHLVTFQVLWRTLYLGENIDEAIEASRIHHQLSPNELRIENTLNDVKYRNTHEICENSDFDQLVCTFRTLRGS